MCKLAKVFSPFLIKNPLIEKSVLKDIFIDYSILDLEGSLEVIFITVFDYVLETYLLVIIVLYWFTIYLFPIMFFKPQNSFFKLNLM